MSSATNYFAEVEGATAFDDCKYSIWFVKVNFSFKNKMSEVLKPAVFRFLRYCLIFSVHIKFEGRFVLQLVLEQFCSCYFSQFFNRRRLRIDEDDVLGENSAIGYLLGLLQGVEFVVHDGIGGN